MSYCSIRGAVTVEKNEKECILENTKNLLKEIIKSNNIDIKNIISIIFTATKDIDAVYPAVAARDMGILKAGLMCVQEMYVKDSLEMCIRILITLDGGLKQELVNHIYLKDTVKLRPDLAGEKFVSVAIDGPAGSGKSTAAKEISKSLGYIYVDTGAMYRSVALYCIENGINTADSVSVEKALENINIDIKYEDGVQQIYLNGDNVTKKIRSQSAAEGASAVATIKKVREKLVYMQKKISLKNNVVMDGRDIGTCVLPDATVKIYMDADVSVRAKRRLGELKERGIACDFEKIKQEIIKRDENDKNREFSPLKAADDAIFFDSTNKTAEDVKKEIIDIINRRI